MQLTLAVSGHNFGRLLTKIQLAEFVPAVVVVFVTHVTT
jgi:hypothetical protein